MHFLGHEFTYVFVLCATIETKYDRNMDNRFPHPTQYEIFVHGELPDKVITFLFNNGFIRLDRRVPAASVAAGTLYGIHSTEVLSTKGKHCKTFTAASYPVNIYITIYTRIQTHWISIASFITVRESISEWFWLSIHACIPNMCWICRNWWDMKDSTLSQYVIQTSEYNVTLPAVVRIWYMNMMCSSESTNRHDWFAMKIRLCLD